MNDEVGTAVELCEFLDRSTPRALVVSSKKFALVPHTLAVPKRPKSHEFNHWHHDIELHDTCDLDTRIEEPIGGKVVVDSVFEDMIFVDDWQACQIPRRHELDQDVLYEVLCENWLDDEPSKFGP